MSDTAWRCMGCSVLFYNLDSKGYPVSGAPDAKFASSEFPRVCSTCHELFWIVSTKTYWQKVEAEYRGTT